MRPEAHSPSRRVHRETTGRAEVYCTVVALVASAADRARLRESVQESARLVFAGELHDVLYHLRCAPRHPSVVLLEHSDAHGRASAGLARQVAHLFPGTPVIGYCHADPARGHELVAFAMAGVHQILLQGIDDSPVAVQRLIHAALEMGIGDTVFAAIDGDVPSRVAPLVRFCLLTSRTTHSVAAAAAGLSVNRKTLVNYCAESRCPPPGALVSWCRLLLAGHYLGQTTMTVEAIAARLGFTSATALRNMLRRYAGMSPLEVRSGGGLDVVRERFLQAIGPRRLG